MNFGTCERSIAVFPLSGRPDWGRLWRHDPPGMHARPGQALVSCSAPLDKVEMSHDAAQQLFIETDEEAAQHNASHLLF